MDLSSDVVPAVVILVANLLSGEHSSLRWENVTAIFGWATAISLIAYALVGTILPNSLAASYLIQIPGFCLITALSRDYERILRPLFLWKQ